jgi:methylase of polypeptide subunit release factors
MTEHLRGLQRALLEAGYDERSMRAAAAAGQPLREPAARAAAQGLALGSDPLSRLLALFWLGEPVDIAAVADLDTAGLEADRLVRRVGDRLLPLVRIDEIDGAYVCSDPTLDEAGAVPPVSLSTRLSAAFTPRPRIAAALDLCAGSGAHALLAARHAERVVATDLAPRAAELTRVNAALNGLANIETRIGSFLEPVRGERFDLVVANPPYVISPDQDFLYRDAGLPGDEISRTLLKELPGLLQDEGYGCLQGNWAHNRDEPWHRPIARDLRGGGCDALLVRYATWSPLAYATAWCAPHHVDDTDELRAAVNRWRARFAADGVEAISGAIVLVRRRAGPHHWRRAISLADVPTGLGDRLPGIVAANDRLAGGDDPLRAHLRPAPGLDVERRQRVGEHERATLNCPSALVTRRPVEPALAEAVLRLDGTRPLGEVLDDRSLTSPIADLLKLGILEYAE